MHAQAAQLPMRKCASPQRLKGSTHCQQVTTPFTLLAVCCVCLAPLRYNPSKVC